MPGKEGKTSIPSATLATQIPQLLDDIQASMLKCATEFRDAHLHTASSLEELDAIVSDGWALIWHCGTPECEAKIKEDTKASSRCFPLDMNAEWEPAGQTRTVCGKPAFGRAYFARAY